MTLDLGAIGTHNVALSLVANHAPAGADKALPMFEDVPYTFSASDFSFTDVDGHTLSAVKITTLPATGLLALNGVAVAIGQSILAADIEHLTWTPPLNFNGNGAGSFTFQVVDNGGTYGGGVDTDQSPNTITFNVAPVNDAPSGTNVDPYSALGYGARILGRRFRVQRCRRRQCSFGDQDHHLADGWHTDLEWRRSGGR